jgi:membrane protein required for colicin V production
MIFTIFDIIILTIIFISTLLGFYRGAIEITINLLGFVLSIIAAMFLAPYLIILLSGYIENSLIVSIIGGICAYMISLVICTFVCSQLISSFTGIKRGWIDRICGVFIGFLRGLLLGFIVFGITAIFTNNTYSKAEVPEDLIFKICEDDYPIWMKESVTVPYLENYLKMLIKITPQDALRLVPMPKSKKNKDSYNDPIEGKDVDSNFTKE